MFLSRANTYIVVGVIVCVGALAYANRSSLAYFGEWVSYSVAPSAERAYQYGVAHFDARYTQQYNVDRAEYFFELAAIEDPNLPYVHHQLARIAFLRGHFSTALQLINQEIETQGNSTSPSTYYVKGLILGYMRNYTASEVNYQKFLETHPDNWAALNDYAWVLLKDNKPQAALTVINHGLSNARTNPWLWNSKATALYELGKYQEAQEAITNAQKYMAGVTTYQWLIAYPGNDPQIASTGLDTFKQAIEDNVHRISLAIQEHPVQ